MTPVWWCELVQRPVRLDLDDELNGRPICSPDLQCTGGRRRSLACGWRYLVPVGALANHLRPDADPCQDRGVDWPCDVADLLLPAAGEYVVPCGTCQGEGEVTRGVPCFICEGTSQVTVTPDGLRP